VGALLGRSVKINDKLSDRAGKGYRSDCEDICVVVGVVPSDNAKIIADLYCQTTGLGIVTELR
jgi:hypothetical protein